MPFNGIAASGIWQMGRMMMACEDASMPTLNYWRPEPGWKWECQPDHMRAMDG
jgi:hypothetical protein